MNNKTIRNVIIGFLGLIFILYFNPLGFNNPTERTVITTAGGAQDVQFTGGVYWKGFLSKSTVYPNQIGVSYGGAEADLTLRDNTVEIGRVTVQFSDGTTAQIEGIAQYILPTNKTEMLEVHNAHMSPEGLVKRRLSPYTQECLNSAAQLMTSEMHYSGGKAQMAQDYLNQLQNGSYLLKVNDVMTYDSVEKNSKRSYIVNIQVDKNGQPKRKFSSIKEYKIVVGDANIIKTDYETAVDSMLAKKIISSTRASVSKQELMTAEQQKLTAKSQGEKKLVDIEYQQKQEQTKQVVAAETKVKLAEQDRQTQEIALKAANLEAQKIKLLADAQAYEKRTAMQANGALEQKLDSYEKVNKYWADAFKDYKGSVTPYIMSGGNGGNQNAAMSLAETMQLKAQLDLGLSMKNQK